MSPPQGGDRQQPLPGLVVDSELGRQVRGVPSDAGGTQPESPSVVVTGAAGDIGQAISTVLANTGWTVVAVDRDDEGLSTLVQRVPEVVAFHGDVSDRRVLAAARDQAEDAGHLAGWVNNAAVLKLGALHSVTDEDIDASLTVNLKPYIVGAQLAVQSFLAHRIPGTIVNVSSIHAEHAFPGYALYDTAKGGINALTRYVCVEYGHLGIRCNAVAPGVVLSPMSLRLNALSPDPEADLTAARDLAPLRRTSAPGEIAAVVAFLLSDAASSISGHILAADNGMAARVNAFPPDPSINFPDGP